MNPKKNKTKQKNQTNKLLYEMTHVNQNNHSMGTLLWKNLNNLNELLVTITKHYIGTLSWNDSSESN